MKYKLNLKSCYELQNKLFSMAECMSEDYKVDDFYTETKTYNTRELPSEDLVKVTKPRLNIDKYLALANNIVDAVEKVGRAAELVKAKKYGDSSYEALMSMNCVLRELSGELMDYDKLSSMISKKKETVTVKGSEEYHDLQVDVEIQYRLNSPAVPEAALSMSKMARINSIKIEEFLATPVEVDMGDNPLNLFDILAMKSSVAVSTYIKQ